MRRTSLDEQSRIKARDAAKTVWLGDHIESHVGDLSHGQQRQLEVAMAMVTNPDLMMLDEPASGLSRGERERLVELLESLAPDVTLLLIEHDMDVALRVANRVVVMADGRDDRRRDSRRDPSQRDRPRRLSRKKRRMSDDLLHVHDLCAGYGTSRVLDGVSFSMGVEAVALIGRNGMGKTTLCNTIMGLVRATSGEIVFNGERIDTPRPGEDRQARCLVRAAGASAVSFVDRRRASDNAGQGNAGQALDARTRIRACSRASPSDAATAGPSCREANSRCSRSVGRCC